MLDHLPQVIAQIGMDQLALGAMTWIKLADGQPPRMARSAAVRDGAVIAGHFYPAYRPGDRFRLAD